MSKSSSTPSHRKPMFVNQEIMKAKVCEALKKPEYNVAKFYHKTGLWSKIATNPAFENFTLVVICVNAIWIAIDADYNVPRPDTLTEAQPIFQIMEHAFCWYFSFEWCVRFNSFKRKRDGLKDSWFVFDSCLVFMMVAETWVVTAVLVCLGSGGGAGAIGNASILRLFRLLRLSRLARMLRSMPELMILIKGMLAATRSVFFTMCLLLILLYLFAIALRQLTEGTPVGKLYFYSVPASMYKLLIEGVFLDNLGTTTDTIGRSGWGFAVVFFVFVCMAALMVMNMLIGVLCEVVSAVAATEKEEMNVLSLKTNLAVVMAKLDRNGNGTLSEKEFVELVTDAKAVALLNEVGVDPIGLIDMAPDLFREDSDEESDNDEKSRRPPKEMNFQEFLKLVLEFRGSNRASVKDLRKLKEELVNEIEGLKAKLVPRRGSRSRQPSIVEPRGVRSQSLPDLFASVPVRSQSVGTCPSVPVLTPDLSPVLPPTRKAPSFCQLEAFSSELCHNAPGRPLDANGADTREVETALRLLQVSLKQMRRPALPGEAVANSEKAWLHWAEGLGRMAESELQKLHVMRKQQALEALTCPPGPAGGDQHPNSLA